MGHPLPPSTGNTQPGSITTVRERSVMVSRPACGNPSASPVSAFVRDPAFTASVGPATEPA